MSALGLKKRAAGAPLAATVFSGAANAAPFEMINTGDPVAPQGGSIVSNDEFNHATGGIIIDMPTVAPGTYFSSVDMSLHSNYDSPIVDWSFYQVTKKEYNPSFFAYDIDYGPTLAAGSFNAVAGRNDISLNMSGDNILVASDGQYLLAFNIPAPEGYLAGYYTDNPDSVTTFAVNFSDPNDFSPVSLKGLTAADVSPGMSYRVYADIAAPIPEPGTGVLLAVGLAAVVVAARRRIMGRQNAEVPALTV